MFLEEQRIRDQLKAIEEQRIQENEYFDVISGFQKVGNKVSPWFRGYIYLFPILAFFFICIFFFVKQFVKFTLSYEK